MASTKGIHRILVVDDEPGVAAFLREALVHDGHLVTLARDGAEALRILAEHKHSIVIADYRMPEKTGLDVLRELRAGGNDVPLILMSSHLPEEAVQACETDPRAELLEKPFSLAELRAMVQRFTVARSKS